MVDHPLFVIEEGDVPAAVAPTKAQATPSAPAPSTSTPAASKQETKPAATPAASTPAPKAIVGDRSESRIKMTQMRQRIATR